MEFCATLCRYCSWSNFKFASFLGLLQFQSSCWVWRYVSSMLLWLQLCDWDCPTCNLWREKYSLATAVRIVPYCQKVEFFPGCSSFVFTFYWCVYMPNQMLNLLIDFHFVAFFLLFLFFFKKNQPTKNPKLCTATSICAIVLNCSIPTYLCSFLWSGIFGYFLVCWNTFLIVFWVSRTWDLLPYHCI